MVDAPPLPRPPSSPSAEPAEPPECLQPSRPRQLPRRVDPLNPPTKETDYQRLQRRRIELADVLARAKSSWPRVKKGPNQRDIKEILLTDAIFDIKRVLRADKCALRRGGQDYKRCLQIMCFMKRQLDILRGKRMSGLRAQAKNGKQGRNVKVRGKLQDEGTLLAMREHMARVGDKLDSENLAQAVVEYWRKTKLSSSADGTLVKERQSVKKAISSRACRKWLSEKAGLKWQDARKGLFQDGHEREDVVAYRQTVFLPTIESLQPSFIPWSVWYTAILDAEEEYRLAGIPEKEYSNQDPITITPTDEHDIIPVYQDECTYNANDGRHQIWCSTYVTRTRPFRLGVKEGLHKDRYAAQVQLECGGDTWFNGELLRAQTILAAIPLFEAAYPGCKALFVFDNATIHLSYRDDALLAQNIALNPGKGTNVRDTFDYRNNRPQKMTDADGKSRGLREILTERGLWRKGMRVQCHKSDGNVDPACLGRCTHCARGIISQEQDFRKQKSELEEAIISRGHLCIILPKFHPETNPIEYYWGATKVFTRKNCGYSLSALRKTIPQAQSSIPRTRILKYFEKAERICQIYASGERYGTEAFQQTAYKSHRRVFAGAC
ncbi:hypothetical protein FN846DRAFT_993445 [Sphaerosporella brunnea]|uniref:Tc1-like transposase DDE domain-containing protein n=1 Tax=Sphaerosporella brunnea TaxID=1250544 RepID=A0A5J5EMU1_9PEZI|nr:hypothetical protein FN846DRAFT_993445 [Sphaerosporella brunnea]